MYPKGKHISNKIELIIILQTYAYQGHAIIPSLTLETAKKALDAH